MVISPCVHKCRFDYENDYCKGCFRRLDDVWDWLSKNDEERLEIIERANQLKEKLKLEDNE